MAEMGVVWPQEYSRMPMVDGCGDVKRMVRLCSARFVLVVEESNDDVFEESVNCECRTSLYRLENGRLAYSMSLSE